MFIFFWCFCTRYRGSERSDESLNGIPWVCMEYSMCKWDVVSRTGVLYKCTGTGCCVRVRKVVYLCGFYVFAKCAVCDWGFLP